MSLIHLQHEKKCYICGKTLDLLSGYCHPIRGKHCMICGDCYDREENSIERWGRFVLWESFNPESPDPSFSDNYPFPKDNIDDLNEKIKHYQQKTEQEKKENQKP